MHAPKLHPPHVEIGISRRRRLVAQSAGRGPVPPAAGLVALHAGDDAGLGHVVHRHHHAARINGDRLELGLGDVDFDGAASAALGDLDLGRALAAADEPVARP